MPWKDLLCIQWERAVALPRQRAIHSHLALSPKKKITWSSDLTTKYILVCALATADGKEAWSTTRATKSSLKPLSDIRPHYETSPWVVTMGRSTSSRETEPSVDLANGYAVNPLSMKVVNWCGACWLGLSQALLVWSTIDDRGPDRVVRHRRCVA